MEKTGRKALFQDAPSNNGNNGGNEILEDWAKILKSAVEGDASAKIDVGSVDGSLKSLGETLNLAIEKISTDSENITNSKRLIRNAQGRWREIIQQNPMPMLLVNKDFKVVTTNPAYGEMSGYTRNDLRKMNLRDFRIVEREGDGIRKAVSSGVRTSGEVVVDLPIGRRTLEQHCIPVKNDADEITNVLLVYQDLTVLRQEMVETQLLTRKAEAFIKQNPQAITVLGPDKSRIDLNKEYERVWRGSYEELMAKKLYDFDITMTGGDDFYASYESKRLSISEMTLNWANGEKTYVTLYQVPILDDTGDILVNYYIYQDRTAEVEEKSAIELLQKQSEAFIKQNPQAITVLGPDKSRIDLNKEYERVWRGSYEELMAKKLYDFDITMTGGDDFYASYESKRLAISEMTLNWANGEKTYVTLYQVPILDDTGDILVNYYIYQDRTGEVEEKEAIQILQKQSESFIKQNPQAIAVLGPDKVRLDLNKEYERVWRGSYEELMAKKLYDFDITMTGGEDFYASYESKRLAISDMELKWPNGEKTYVRLYQVPILDDKGDILVNYYIYQDLTKEISVEKYLNNEVERLKGNLEMFARGDLKFNSVVDEGNEYTTAARDNFAQINESIDGVRDAVGSLLTDVETLVEATVEGKLDTRVDASAHNGDFANVIEGINDTLDAMVGPLNVAAEYIDRISKGDIPEKVTDDMKGDFNEIKNNLNQCIDAFNLVTDDVKLLAEAGIAGNLDVRADQTRHQGVFGEYIEGINNMLNASGAPLQETMGVLERMAQNDYTTKIENEYAGDYAKLTGNLNGVLDVLNTVLTVVEAISAGDMHYLEGYKAVGRRCENDRLIPSFVVLMENLQAVVDDANMLAEAGVNGQLDVRADATRHAGAYREVIGGINNCLDAVVGPLNVAAEYVDRIGKGDIPERIKDAYAGDFNEIKNNLNGCIDAVNLLVTDTNMLVGAAAAGKLTARADISQHAGDYAKIVGGINQTLDIINAPFREVNGAIEQLEITADETSRGADEIGKAAEQVAVTSQLCADLSTSLINQIEAVDRQVADLSASNEEIASTSQEVHEHAVQTAKIGEKAQTLGAEANAKMNNVEVIAKQSVDEINTLNSRMKEIDNVVKQVNDITNQINLLALNAAIEAARAGEHGRGFAVVAGEVRNLAEEAKQATGQIDQVIAGVQAISAKTAEGIGIAHTEIGSGVASVNETISALNEIVQGSQDMKVNIDEIARAIEEQANMANHIVEAMEESGRLTRETQGQVEELASLAEEASASTEEIGSSIHEVKNMADGLKQTMDRFEV